MRVWLDKYGAAVSVCGHVLALKPRTAREYFSERNRLGCTVRYLPLGWRYVHRRPS